MVAGTNLIWSFILVSITNSNQLRQHSISHLEGRVVNGIQTSAEEYPFIAYILYGRDSNESCTGSVLQLQDPAVILTAAHCRFCENMQGIKVYLYRDKAVEPKENDPDYYRVSSFIIHENYDEYTLNDDIGLIFLERNIEDDRVETVELPEDGDYCEDHEPLQIIGYGRSGEHSEYTETLNYADLQCEGIDECKDLDGYYLDYKQHFCHDLNDETVCAEQFRQFIIDHPMARFTHYDDHGEITEDMLCAIADDSDACEGDSGGPLIKTGTNVQIGITSWGHGCNRGVPGVYTNLYHFTEWIHGKIENYGEDDESECHHDECNTNSFMADIRIYDGDTDEWLPWCTGSILSLSPGVILTSAFCLYEIYVYELGVYLLPRFDNNVDVVDVPLMTISRYEIHPDYDASFGDNDIGLLFLHESLVDITGINTISISSTNCDPELVETCHEHGRLSMIGFNQEMLKYKSSSCIELDECIYLLNEYYNLTDNNLTTVIDQDGICIDIPKYITEGDGFHINDRIPFDGMLVGWNADDDECKIHGQGRKRPEQKERRRLGQRTYTVTRAGYRGSKIQPVSSDDAPEIPLSIHSIEQRSGENLPWVYNNLCGYIQWIEEKISEYPLILSGGVGVGGNKIYNCDGLTEFECAQMVDIEGDSQCGWNSIDEECFGVVSASGDLGSGTFDDGFDDGESAAKQEFSQLWTMITVLSIITVGLLSVIIGVYVREKNKTVNVMATILDDNE